MSIPAATSPARRKSASLGTRIWRGRMGYLFLLPTFVFITYFIYFPVAKALQGAFSRWDGFNPPEWVGLANFTRAFHDPVLGIATRNILIMLAFSLVLAIIPSLFAATMIFRIKSARAQYFYRSLFVTPLVVPTVVGLLLWMTFYRSDGLINELLGALHLKQWQHLWLGDTHTALYSISLLGFPWIYPFNLLVFYAGLQAIPSEVLEAAKLDGADGWRRFRYIELPLLAPQLRLLLLLALIDGSQKLLEPMLLTSGGPGYATMTPSLHMYKTAVGYGEFGYSMAISILLFIVVASLTGINSFLSNRENK